MSWAEDRGRILEHLPEEPPDGMVEWAVDQFGLEELYSQVTVFRRESVEFRPKPEMLMTPETMADREKATRRRWAAVCDCSACG